ncbi:type I-D CRISPR-associated protein Cas10d/Csc3 [Methylacidiphilum caldifontis]|uniref:Type I-D CRISPR-associated protein Cas10d/Csc3 n=1 Tax=Methylacidiphilum caldifontis TaxID=2795386 RepID=A0A4Y8PB02_9BACT|nr:type I-D CRISPR-associated protein Cas10d/Csc3 [Methylacidiphilum caldifontis]TFE67815.1 hypothetical protein A7Q10_09045 [Methylacidiphilum caldifontis]
MFKFSIKTKAKWKSNNSIKGVVVDMPDLKGIQVELLKTSLFEKEDDLIKDLLDAAGEKLIRTYSMKTAKGGEYAEELKALGKDVSRSYHDQSMLSHIFNGFFPVWNILKKIEQNGILKLSDFEKKIYLTSFILHDIDKTLGKKFDTSSDYGVSALKDLIKTEINNLGLNIFFSGYINYLGDIAYIVINTQERWGSNRFPPHFGTRLKERQLQLLTDLSTLSDLFSSILKSPSDVLTQYGQKICDRLKNISNNSLTLDFHKLAEVRGVLTNILNNSLIELYSKNGRTPLLFFPDGVVYLKEINLPEVIIDLETLYETISNRIKRVASQRIIKLIPDFSKDDDLRFPDLVYDVCGLQDILSVILTKSINSNRKRAEEIAHERLSTLLSLQKSGKIRNNLQVVVEERGEITIIGRFLQTIEKKVINRLFSEEEKEKIIHGVVRKLAKDNGLDAYERLNAINNKTLKGGPAFKWFYIGLLILKQNPSFSYSEIEEKLREANEYILKNENKICYQKSKLLYVLKEYLRNVILFPMLLDSNNNNIQIAGKNFQLELSKYTLSKSKRSNNEGVCILCNSVYSGEESKESEVPFKPQSYKNRLHIGMNSPKSFICNVCRIELSLRQLLFNQNTSHKNFESEKIKYFYIYPSYYFTTQTSPFVESVQNELKNINYYDIHKKICGRLNSVDMFRELELNIINPERMKRSLERSLAEKRDDDRYLKIKYPENEIPTFVFFGFKGWGDTDTDSWVYPALLALVSPYLFSSKILTTESPIPLFHSGSDFYESVFYDSIHPAFRFVLKDTAIRLDLVEESLRKLLALYTMHYETFKEKWTLLNQELREVATDSVGVFFCFDVKIRALESERKRKLHTKEIESIAKIYWDVFEIIGGKEMGLISETVDKYAKFYKANGFSHYAMTRPLRIASESIIKSSKALSDEDIKLQVIGEIKEWIDRIKGGGAEGYVPKGMYGSTLMNAILEYVNYFYNEVFKKYAEGDRALLKKKMNDFSSGCYAYYFMNYIWSEKETKEGEKNAN